MVLGVMKEQFEDKFTCHKKQINTLKAIVDSQKFEIETNILKNIQEASSEQ